MTDDHRKTVENGRDARGRFTPGNGGGGRPVEYPAFKARCQAFVDAEGYELLASLARQPGPEQVHALRLLVEHGFGKPQAHVDVTAAAGETIKAYIGVDLDRV